MEESKKPAESWIQMPGGLSFEATLAPYESKTRLLQIPADYDFLLHRITCRARPRDRTYRIQVRDFITR